MMFPAYLFDLGSYLQSNGIGTLGVDLHYRGFDNTAIDDITLVQIAGRGNSNAVSKADLMYNVGLRILVRFQDGDYAEEKANEIFELLNLVTNQSIGTTRFKRIEAVSPPWFNGVDLNICYIYSMDFDIDLQ